MLLRQWSQCNVDFSHQSLSFRYQKRIKLGGGLGVNVSSSGVSTSYRTRGGTMGTRGFSIKTGIPGLSYRSSWGRGKNAFVFLLIYFLVVAAFLVIYNLVAFIIYLVTNLFYVFKSWLTSRNKQRELKNRTAGEL